MRCKNGTRKNKKTGECEPTKNTSKPLRTFSNLKRCPNGTQKNKKTGICEPKKKIEKFNPDKNLATIKNNNMENTLIQQNKIKFPNEKKNKKYVLNWNPSDYEYGDVEKIERFTLYMSNKYMEHSFKVYFVYKSFNSDGDKIYQFTFDENPNDDSLELIFSKKKDNSFELIDYEGDSKSHGPIIAEMIEFILGPIVFGDIKTKFLIMKDE
jgi:hypothetical protein